MNLILTNTSRYPTRAVRWLATFAARYVRGVAEQEGWLERFQRHPLALNVTNCRHAYRGRSLGVRDAKPWTPGSPPQRCFLVRIGAPEKFPCDSTYARYKDMPEARLNDWQEAVVGLTAHELSHTQYTYAGGDRKGAEESCELVELDCMDAFRKARADYDAFMQAEAVREQEAEQRQAAKCSPEAVHAAALTKAGAMVKRWTTKQKLANTKLRQWSRKLRRLEAKGQR